jgi:adenylate cyclase
LSSPYRNRNRKVVLQLIIGGCLFGIAYSFAENYWKGTTLGPLLIRAIIGVPSILLSIAWFETLIRDLSRKMNFLVMLLVKSAAYVLIITILLMVINGVNDMIAYGISLSQGINIYIHSDMYFKNVLIMMCVVVVGNILIMVNSLHRPGELISFVLGRYHQPREVERIFLFIDLNDSTTLAEKLGHFRFGKFLQSYYADVSAAVRLTGGMVNDYIGDEVVISWKMAKGLRHQQCTRCFFLLEEIIRDHRDYFQLNFGTIPHFKAGMHAGSVVVMWVGNEKKEIVYLGDVLNTTKRIQTECSRLNKNFLVSGSLLEKLGDMHPLRTAYHGPSQLKGKQAPIEIYSIEVWQ